MNRKPINQCDGCRRGLPVNEHGIHVGPSGFWGGDMQGCTKELYVNDNLIEYRVTLHENKGDKFTLVFDCWAEDPDHAAEQALDAYPAAEIINTTPLHERGYN